MSKKWVVGNPQKNFIGLRRPHNILGSAKSPAKMLLFVCIYLIMENINPDKGIEAKSTILGGCSEATPGFISKVIIPTYEKKF